MIEASRQDGFEALPLALPHDAESAGAILYAEDRRELTEELLRLTGAVDPALRGRAALAVGRVGLPIGAPRLMELLRDPDPAVRALAAFGLGLLELDLEPQTSQAVRRRITERLLPLLSDPSPLVVQQAVWALGVRADPLATGAIASLLAEARPSSVLAAALGAWWRLPGASPTAVAPLVGAPDSAVRHAAANTLRRLGDPDAMPLLEVLLADPDPQVRAAAAHGLQQAPAAAARRHLVELLRDDDWRVASAALGWAAALWRDGAEIEDDALSAVIGASLGHDRHVQRLAFEALALAASDFTVPEDRLVQALRTGEATTRLAAVEALAAAGGGILDDALDDVLEVYGIDEPPQEPGVAVVPAMLADGPLEAAAVVRAIGESGEDDGDDWLRVLADHGPTAARAEALRQLRERHPGDAERLAAGWLQSGPPVLKAVAAQVVMRARVAGTLAPRGEDEDDWTSLLWVAQRDLDRNAALETRLVILDSLLTLADETIRSRAAALLPDPDRVVRLWAVRNVRPDPGSPSADLVAAALGPADTGRSEGDYRQLAAELLEAPTSHPELLVHTPRGDFAWELRLDWAPLSGKAILDWVVAGEFEDLVFHRVIPNFVVQTGDPTAVGYGGAPGSLRSEETPIPYTAGTVGLALAGRDTGGSQFFVVSSAQPHLTGLYPVLGRVTTGQGVVDRIQPGDAVSITLREFR